MNKPLNEYVNELMEICDDISEKYDANVGLNIMHLAVSMWNTDHMNQNITANMNITESEYNG